MNLHKSYCAVMIIFLLTMLGFMPVYKATADDNTSIEDVKKETQDLFQALKSYTADQRNEAVRNTRTVLENLDRKIEELEARLDAEWDNLDKAARTKARESLKELRRQRNQVAEWLGSLKSSSAEAWENMKEGFLKAYKALYNAWEKSEKEFQFDEKKPI